MKVFKFYAIVAVSLMLSHIRAIASDDASVNIYLEATPQTANILSRFEDRFAIMDSVIFNNISANLNGVIINDSVFYTFPETARVEAVDAATLANISAMKSKTELDFRGQTYFRPGKGLNYDPDDPLVAYNAKFQAELQWNLFNSSIYKRGTKTRELELEGDLRQLNYIRDDMEQQILAWKQQVRYRYYSYLLWVVRLHSENVQLLLDTQMYLLEHGKISGEDFLSLINEQSELERRLISIQADSVITEQTPPSKINYILYTDTMGILNSIRTKNNNLEMRKLGLRKDILGTRLKNIDYLQTMNLQPFVRFSYYNRPTAYNTYNLDLGVAFTIPLSKEVAAKRNAIRAEQSVLQYEMDELEAETSRAIFLTFHDLEIYNENVKGEFNRMQNLKKFIELRTGNYRNVDGEYSRINRLVEYNAYLKSWERLLEYIYQRDMALIQLQSYLLYEPISSFISFTQLN